VRFAVAGCVVTGAPWAGSRSAAPLHRTTVSRQPRRAWSGDCLRLPEEFHSPIVVVLNQAIGVPNDAARGALADEEAVTGALRLGHIRHAGLDVFAIEPLTAGYILVSSLESVSLSAHSAFRTPEASDNLINAAFDHCRRIAATDH
jgi:hypothetical protein